MLGSGGTGGSGSGGSPYERSGGGRRGEKRPLPLPKARGSVHEVAAAKSVVAAKSVAAVRTGDPVVSMADGDMLISAKAPPSAGRGGGVG